MRSVSLHQTLSGRPFVGEFFQGVPDFIRKRRSEKFGLVTDDCIQKG
jgi:hypothetical protein